ncbi:Velvet factor [Penicillium fimorum]|uniref:Velvet factor n=1 Tax=Penicillium fimorum TaxID=1882269 RepID=A0A9W9Y615_9EURO|nr:Velvet factor [Penicillium fimorum]
MDVAKSLRVKTDDIWAAAIATLEKDVASQIDFSQKSKQHALDELLAATEDAKKRLDGKSWFFLRKNGKRIFLRDVLSKLAHWVDHFKEIGDIIVQYDPVHAALPWAGVRFLLNIAMGDLKTYNELLETITDVAEILCRHAPLERLLKQAPSQAAEELGRTLVKLYASILTYLAKAKAYYLKNTPQRVINSGILASSDLKSAFMAISKSQEDQYVLCSHAAALLDRDDELRRILENFDAPINRWDKSLNAITDELDEEPYEQHHEQTKNDVLEGTGMWLLRDPTFLHWKNESASSIFWLYGDIGSGKSKLTSLVVDNAENAFRSSLSQAPVYFYCLRSTTEPARSDPSKILASIARQLSTIQSGGPLLDAAIEVYKLREQNAHALGPLRLDESKNLILKLLEQYKDTTITIVIDALDECNETSRGSLVDALEFLRKASPCLLKIFISSRKNPDIAYKLDSHQKLCLSPDRNSNDIHIFVQSEVKRLIENGSLLRFSTRKEELRDKIIHELSYDAKGMFLWASLQIHALCQQNTDHAIRERLGRLPKTLREHYQEVLTKIENLDADADSRFAQNAFSWLLCSKSQLKSEVFLAAVSVTSDGSAFTISKDQLIGLCNNLVILDTSLDAFRFSHLSVREFLEEKDMYKSASTNALVAEACLWNIAMTKAEGVQLPPLLRYSCVFWGPHAQAAAERLERLKEPLLKFLPAKHESSSCFFRWHRMIEQENLQPWGDEGQLRLVISNKPSVLLVVCVFDLLGFLNPREWKHLARERPKNINGWTHEQVTIYCGSSRILKWIFNNGMPFQVNEEVLKGAAYNEKCGREIVSLLLEERGAEIKITEDIVEAAASNWRCGREIVSLLLDKRGAEIKITEDIVKAAASNWRCGKEIVSLLLKERGAKIKITEDIVKAAAGNPECGKEIVSLLLEERGAKIKITEDIVKAAAKNKECGKEIVSLLLKELGAEIKITEGIVKAAAGNPECGREIVSLLLEERGAKIKITEDIVKAAASNWRCGEEIVSLLLKERGAKIKITEDIVKAAAGNPECGKEIVSLLLEERGAKIKITEDIVKAAAKNKECGKEIVSLLLKELGAEIKITEGIVKAAAGNPECGREIVSLLLEERGAKIKITEDIVKAAASNWRCGEEIVSLLLKERGAQIEITEGIVKAAAGNPECGKEIVSLLLKERGAKIKITEDIVKAAAGNPECGKEIVSLLLEERGAEIKITEDIVKAAAKNKECGKEIVSLLLKELGAEIKITEGIVKAAAGNPECGREIVSLLLKERGAQIEITEGIVKAAAGNPECGKEIVSLLLEERGAEIKITEDIVKAAASNWRCGKEIVSLLLKERGAEIKITEDIVKAAASNWRCGKEIVSLLLKERAAEIKITEDIVEAAASNWGCGNQIVSLLLKERAAEIKITEDIVEAAAKNKECGKEIVSLLLEERGAEIKITEDIVKAAASNWRCGKEIVSLLLKERAAEIKITEDIVKAAAGNPECGREIVSLLLEERGAKIKITEGIVKAAASNWRCGKEIVSLLLKERGAKIKITEDIVKAAAGNPECGREIVSLLLDKRGAEIKITEDIVKAAASNWKCAKEIVTLLLDERGAKIKITEGIVKAAASNWRCGKEIVSLLLKERGAKIKITEDIVKAAAGNPECGREIVSLLLDKRGAEIKITEDIVKAAASNWKCAKEIVTLLLDERGAEIQITEDILEAAAQTEECPQIVTLLLEYNTRSTMAAITSKVCFAAASCGQLSSLRYLCQHIPPTTRSTHWDAIARFYHAAEHGNVGQIKRYLNEPIPFDTKNGKGQTPLWIAAFSNQTKVVEILALQKAVDVNSLSDSGQSPIFWPSAYGREEMVKILLSVGARTHFVDAEGQTAVSMARQHGHDNVLLAFTTQLRDIA